MRTRGAPTRALLVAVILAITIAPAGLAQGPRPDMEELERRYRDYLEVDRQLLCGTGALLALQRGRGGPAVAPLADGTPVYFRQDPPVIPASYDGTVTLREFTVVGDVEELTFEPSILDTNQEAENETFRRQKTRTVGAVEVSVFEPSWSGRQLDRFFFAKRTGFDRPGLFLGRVVSGGERFSVWLRVAPDALPDVEVHELAEDVHYSSDVVNLVIPGYGDSRIVDGGFDIDATEVTRKFYESFRDVYHGIAIIPRAVHLSSGFAAFHRNVQNAVSGVGLNISDNTAAYGSNGTLLGVEFYPHAEFGRARTTVHEFLHQWGHYLDWQRIAGIQGAGHEPEGHTPLLHPLPTLFGAVLTGDRDVADGGSGATKAGGFAIGFPEVPYVAHPLSMYAMGFFGPGKVPKLTLFQDQGQFDASTVASPDVGTPVQGGSTEVGMAEIRDVHGPRSGPKAPRRFRRATVVVSRDEPLTQEEFNYWTWVTQRQAYRKRNAGALSWDGYGTLFQATRFKIKLETGIRARSGPRLRENLDVAFPVYRRDVWRAVRFDSRIPTRMRPGRTIDLSGRVTADDRSDFDQILIHFVKHDPEAGSRPGIVAPFPTKAGEGNVELFAAVGSDGRFEAEVQFSRAQRGRYTMDVVLFWPGSGSQYARASRTPIHVQ